MGSDAEGEVGLLGEASQQIVEARVEVGLGDALNLVEEEDDLARLQGAFEMTQGVPLLVQGLEHRLTEGSFVHDPLQIQVLKGHFRLRQPLLAGLVQVIEERGLADLRLADEGHAGPLL